MTNLPEKPKAIPGDLPVLPGASEFLQGLSLGKPRTLARSLHDFFQDLPGQVPNNAAMARGPGQGFPNIQQDLHGFPGIAHGHARVFPKGFLNIFR